MTRKCESCKVLILNAISLSKFGIRRASKWAGSANRPTYNPCGERQMKNRILLVTIKLQNLLASEEGQDLIEYALVVALVAFGATAAMGTLATKISNTFTQIGTSLSTTIT